MFLERIEVEEGFLNRFRLDFVQGLNVIIGGRGTGKTSVIELLRFALGVESHLENVRRASLDHARSVLTSGQVTVTLTNGSDRIVITRTAEDSEPRCDSVYPKPIIFSQTEIESLGLVASGRRRLLDAFTVDLESYRKREEYLITEIKSTSRELHDLKSEISSMDERLHELPDAKNKLAAAIDNEQNFAKHSEKATELQKTLNAIRDETEKYTIRESIYERTVSSIDSLHSRLKEATSSVPEIETWPETAGPEDLLKEIRSRYHAVVNTIVEQQDQLDQLSQAVRAAQEQNREEKSPKEEQAREIRKQINDIKEGAGQAAREVSNLREKVANLDNFKSVRAQKKTKYDEIRSKRDAALDRLDEVRTERFNERHSAAQLLNGNLSPRIKISVNQAAIYDEYIGVLEDTLRGSGLKYKELVVPLSKNMSPRELVEAAEEADYDLVADTLNVTKDRASRLLNQVLEANVGDILTAQVDDNVELELLDGTDYKDITDLSIGQRCTVILPIVLQHTDYVLIVDQPEDHLDNQFIVDTLIQAIQNRSGNVQTVFTSHNANIPVLGEASQVAQLGSDGKKAFLVHVGSLDEDRTVEAITTVMEGGREAFERRARFYEAHPAKND